MFMLTKTKACSV